MAPSRLPPWLTAVLANRRINPNRGIPLRTSVLGRQRSALDSDDIVTRGRRGSSSRKRQEKPDAPEEVLQRLRDQGYSEDEIGEIVNEEKSDGFDPFSPSDYLGKGGDILSGVLNTLDIPRAAITSGLVEASDVYSKITGADPVQGTDRLRQTGASWQDFVQNFNNRVGFADVLEGNPDDDLFGVSTENPAVQAGIGFAVDVATDPLNYLGVGLADDATKVAKLFRSDNAIQALGRQGADDAAAKVLQKGVTSLDEAELSAIGRTGGLYLKTPGTGAIGRTLKLDKLMGSPERYTTLAKRGSTLGDLASGAAQVTRKGTGLNALSRAVGGGAAKRGLAGSLGPLTAAVRGADDRFGALDALVVKGAETQGRHLAKGFEARMMNEWKRLLSAAKTAGVNGQELFHAVGGATNNVSQSEPRLVQAFRDFLEVARTEANSLAGRDFIPQQANYVPRILTDEAKDKFGIGAQARGQGGTRSMTRKRKYTPGQSVKIGNGVSIKLLDPLDPKAGGLSVEEQIENALAANNMTKWYKDDALDVIPEYISKLSGQLRDEWMGGELQRKGIAEELWRTRDDLPPESMGQRLPRSQTGLHRRQYQKLSRELGQAEQIVQQFGAKSRQAKALPWNELYAKATKLGADWEPHVQNALKDIMRQTGEKWAQFGTGAALPADMVSVLRDVGRMSEPSVFPKVMAIHDRAMRGWKKLALLTPGYHWRNSFGGVFMNWLADVDEGRYAQLERLIANDPDSAPFFRGTKTVTRAAPTINDPQLVEAYEEAKKFGIFTGGQSIKEIEQVTDSRWPSLFRGSRRLGGAIENRLRGALFIDEYVKNGGDSSLALDKVMKYHFDYEDLGGAEEKIRQLAVPFYTYTRRSIPLMLEMIVRNPGKMNRYFQAKDNIERLSAEERIVPEYFERNFAIRLPWTDDGSQVYGMPDLPIFSLVEGSDPNQALGQISPVIKTPLELGFGQQIWKGIPLENEPVEIPSAVRFLTPALRAMGRIRTDSEGNERMSDRDLYLLQQVLPQIGQYRRLFPSEDAYEERRMTSVLSFLFGVGTRTNTDREQTNELWRRFDPYREEVETNRDLGFEGDEAREMVFD